MLSEQDAIQTLISHARLLVNSEEITLSEANGRICAGDIIAPINVPDSDNSAMDGFACNSMDDLTHSPVKISQRITAGHMATQLEPGTAARIFTGANLPKGADCVVPQEDCDYDEHSVHFKIRPVTKRHVRYAGEDIAKGELILQSGDAITPAQIGIIASLGINTVRVYRRLRIALLSTGDELVEPGSGLETGKRYNSNCYALTAAFTQLGFAVTHHSIVADTLEQTQSELERHSKDADVIISTGGVSVGDEDHVKMALQNIGTMYLWKIAIKPGKPLAFGLIKDTPFIGLPGNPVSAMITFLIIARPFLLRCQGVSHLPFHQYPVKSAFEWRTQKRCEYLRVSLKQENGILHARPYCSQDSGIQSSLHYSDGLVRIDKERNICVGDTVDFIPYSALFSLTS